MLGRACEGRPISSVSLQLAPDTSAVQTQCATTLPAARLPSQCPQTLFARTRGGDGCCRALTTGQVAALAHHRESSRQHHGRPRTKHRRRRTSVPGGCHHRGGLGCLQMKERGRVVIVSGWSHLSVAGRAWTRPSQPPSRGESQAIEARAASFSPARAPCTT
jgi:hypothetical protein